MIASPLTYWELTAVAVKMVQRADCDAYISAQVRRLDELGDAAGVATWRAIAMKVRAIRDAPAV